VGVIQLSANALHDLQRLKTKEKSEKGRTEGTKRISSNDEKKNKTQKSRLVGGTMDRGVDEKLLNEIRRWTWAVMPTG
jgi:hypothetical protein